MKGRRSPALSWRLLPFLLALRPRGLSGRSGPRVVPAAVRPPPQVQLWLSGVSRRLTAKVSGALRSQSRGLSGEPGNRSQHRREEKGRGSTKGRTGGKKRPRKGRSCCLIPLNSCGSCYHPSTADQRNDLRDAGRLSRSFYCWWRSNDAERVCAIPKSPGHSPQPLSSARLLSDHSARTCRARASLGVRGAREERDPR